MPAKKYPVNDVYQYWLRSNAHRFHRNDGTGGPWQTFVDIGRVATNKTLSSKAISDLCDRFGYNPYDIFKNYDAGEDIPEWWVMGIDPGTKHVGISYNTAAGALKYATIRTGSHHPTPDTWRKVSAAVAGIVHEHATSDFVLIANEKIYPKPSPAAAMYAASFMGHVHAVCGVYGWDWASIDVSAARKCLGLPHSDSAALKDPRVGRRCKVKTACNEIMRSVLGTDRVKDDSHGLDALVVKFAGHVLVDEMQPFRADPSKLESVATSVGRVRQSR